MKQGRGFVTENVRVKQGRGFVTENVRESE